MSLALHVLGLLAVTLAAALVYLPLGLFVLGGSCFILEHLTREDHPR